MISKTDIGSKSSILGNSVFGASSQNTNLLLTFLGSTSICDSCLKFFIKLVNVHPIKGHEGPEGEYSYGSALSFTSALGGGGEATSRNSRLNPGERLPVRIAQAAGCAPAPDWEVAEQLATTGCRFPNSPVCSQSLHRLRYPGPSTVLGLQTEIHNI